MAYGWRAIAIALVSLSGCFSDSPTTGGAEGSTGDSCSIGSLACDCTDGHACDAGLECHLPSNTCIDGDCTPGDGLCICDGTSCADGFICIDDYCEPEAPATTGMTSTPGSMTNETLPDDTFGTAGTTFDPTGFTEVGTSGPPTTGMTTDSTTSMLNECGMCLVTARDGKCFDDYDMCGDACDPIFDCNAQDPGLGCCLMHEPPQPQWNNFANCATVCDAPCGYLGCLEGLDSTSL